MTALDSNGLLQLRRLCYPSHSYQHNPRCFLVGVGVPFLLPRRAVRGDRCYGIHHKKNERQAFQFFIILEPLLLEIF